MYLVQQVVDVFATDQAYVALAEQATHFSAHLVLGHTRHDHERHHVVQHTRQQAVLVIL